MTTTLYDQLERRILLLDGGFGTMVQGYGLQEEDYRGRSPAGRCSSRAATTCSR